MAEAAPCISERACNGAGAQSNAAALTPASNALSKNLREPGRG
ncbi:MAG TPA: hypothetical protein VGC77_14380 [Rhodopseudomonas sp.]